MVKPKSISHSRKVIFSFYALVLLSAFFLYSYRLNLVPVHLNQDELMFALNGYSIAQSGHDWYGNLLPFYFWHLQSFWATPVIVYLSSLVFLMFPLSEASARLTSVFVGVFNIGIMMGLALLLFKNHKIALFSGLLLLLTPVHMIHSRLLLDNLYTVPFVLLWLYFLKRFIDSGSLVLLFLSTLSLGMGLHSYHAAKLVMPLYFFLTSLLIFFRKEKILKNIAVASFGFAIPIMLFIPWLVKHPDTLLNQVSYIGSLDKSVNVERGLLGVFSPARLSFFINNYVSYFSPEILFTNGDRSSIHSTGLVGAFFAPVAILMIFGMLQIIFHQKDHFSKIILLGLLTYPLAPAIVNDPQRISRGLVVIPFMILVATYGIWFLLHSAEKSFKPLLIGILAVIVFQFTAFLGDYFGEYRSRSFAWFNNDIGGGLESVIKSTQIRPVKQVYLDGNIPFIDLYAQFYQIQANYFYTAPEIIYDYRTEDLADFPNGSLVLVRSDHVSSLDRIGMFEKVETIREPNGNETFYIYFRDPVIQ